MSDFQVTDDVKATGDPVVQTQEQTADAPVESETTRLRVAGMPFHSSFTFGEDGEQVTVTREGTDVPTDQVEGIVQAASDAGISLEVVPQ